MEIVIALIFILGVVFSVKIVLKVGLKSGRFSLRLLRWKKGQSSTKKSSKTSLEAYEEYEIEEVHTRASNWETSKQLMKGTANGAVLISKGVKPLVSGSASLAKKAFGGIAHSAQEMSERYIEDLSDSFSLKFATLTTTLEDLGRLIDEGNFSRTELYFIRQEYQKIKQGLHLINTKFERFSQRFDGRLTKLHSVSKAVDGLNDELTVLEVGVKKLEKQVLSFTEQS